MWGELFGSIFSWLGGESIAASLTRVAIGMGLMRYLNKSNENAQPTGSTQTPQGIRQQISPATENKIPVVYGDAYLGGTIIDVQLVNDNKELYAVLALCEKTGDLFSSGAMSSITIDDIYFNNNKITFKADGTTLDYVTDDTGVQDTNGSGLLGIYLYKGDSNSPMLPCQSGTTTPITGTVPPVAYEVMPGWGASHTMENIVFAVIKMNYDPSKGLRSIPNLKFHVRNTLNKPGDVLHDYMTNDLYGGSVDAATIDSVGIAALNSYSDQSVTYPGHAAQKRYVINGVIRTTETVMSNMQRIAGSAGSNVTYDISTGKWSVVIGKTSTKALDFDDSNIIGQIAITGTALDSYYNSVEVQFPYAYLRDQMNFVRIDLPEAMRNANEPDNQLQITHELVNNVVQANILGNMDLRQSREDLAITFNTDYSKFNIQVGDVIGITNAVYSWTSKLFKVIRVKKNESEDGRLTLEITAQSYNDDIYTVEDIADFTPTIGAGHSIPNLGAIQKPNAPTVDTGTTISSQPSITITGVVPSGVVTEMEFWFTPDDTEPNDNLRKYYLLGTTRAENSGPFDIGASTQFKTVLLNTDNYYFKVRAANQYGSSAFSDPTGPINYIYTQAPDVLPYTTPAVDANGNKLEQDGQGLNLGMLAMYAASKLNWGNILSGNVSSWSDLFGINSNAASTVNSAVTSENAAISQGANASAKASEAITTANEAKELANQALGNQANVEVCNDTLAKYEPDDTLSYDEKTNISANCELSSTKVVNTINGKVFPCIFGSGPNHGEIDSRAGIFTHDHFAFGGPGATAKLKEYHVISKAKKLQANVYGHYQNFYNIPTITSGNWSRKPYYDETLTNKFEANTQVTLYYTTATYTSGNLDQQSWGPWRRLVWDNGVDEIRKPVTDIDTGTHTLTFSETKYTNPIPTIEDIPYIIEDIKVCGGAYDDAFSDAPGFIEYDPFKPNIARTKVTTVSTVKNNKPTDELDKILTLTYPERKRENAEVQFNGGTNELILFGVSVFNLPDNTPFNNNTVFGHVSDHYLNTYPNAISIRQIVNNGSIFVGINTNNNFVYWSDDGNHWHRIAVNAEISPLYPIDIVGDVNTRLDDWLVEYYRDGSYADGALPNFTHITYDGTKFYAYATSIPHYSGDTPTDPYYYRIATSTDGKNWDEITSTSDLRGLYKIFALNGKHAAICGEQTGTKTIKYSTDGINWSNSTTQVTNATCLGSDGTNLLMGAKRVNTTGAALYQSSNGNTWTEVPYFSQPGYATTAPVTDNGVAQTYAVLQNEVEEYSLP